MRHLPDLPGCVALGFTLEETEELIRGAVQQQLQGMREGGDPIFRSRPTPLTSSVKVPW